MAKSLAIPKPTTEQAQELLQKDRDDRINRCLSKVQQALKEENCDFTVTATLTSDKTTFNINIKSN